MSRVLPGGFAAQWKGKAVGEAFAIRDDLPIDAPPPSVMGMRFIRLTASDAYNDGVLINETFIGSAPLIEITAEINLPSSRAHGKTINLINTERRFIGAGESGLLEDDAIQNITGVVGGTNYWPTGNASGAFANRSGVNISQGEWTAVAKSGFSFDASRVARTSDHTRPRTQRATYYMRIL